MLHETPADRVQCSYMTVLQVRSCSVVIGEESKAYLILFLGNDNKNFGLIVCVLGETVVAEEDRIHPGGGERGNKQNASESRRRNSAPGVGSGGSVQAQRAHAASGTSCTCSSGSADEGLWSGGPQVWSA